MNAGAGDSGGDENGSDGRKSGKRELSTSKRAAQNRAAQVRDLHRVVRPSCDDVAMNFGSKIFLPHSLGDKDRLLNDYYSALLDNERKATSRA